MGKKREERRAKSEEAKKEKPIFGSGAEPQPEPKDDGLVECVCTVPCAWRGYHDEGDRVFVEKELLESDPFFKGHFKPLEPLPEGQRRQDGEEAAGGEGAQSQATEHDGNADGEGAQSQATEYDGNADGEEGNADGGTANADGKGGQGELGLK